MVPFKNTFHLFYLQNTFPPYLFAGLNSELEG